MATTNENDRSTERLTSNERSETDPAAESTTPECDECGSYVTRDYHRVFSDNDGELHGCLACKGRGADRGGRR